MTTRVSVCPVPRWLEASYLDLTHFPSLQEAAHLGLEPRQGKMHVRVEILVVQPLDRVINPILTVPLATVSYNRNLGKVSLKVMQLVWRDISDDVTSPPRVAILDGHIVLRGRRECVNVADDLVVVSAAGRGADEDGPV